MGIIDTTSTTLALLSSSSTSLLLRGGAVNNEDDDDEEEEEDDDDDDEEEDSLLSFGSSFDDDLVDHKNHQDNNNDMMFAEETFVSRFLVSWTKTPPLTKAYLTASMAATAFGYVFYHNEFPKWLGLDSYGPILTKLQVWRPLTAFLNFGPFGLGYLMTAHFVWTYMSTLERLNHDRPYDFWIMILFGQVSMVIGYPILKLSPKFLGHNLSTFLVYVWSRYHEGVEVNMFELFNTRAELLPWFFLAQVSKYGTM